MPRSTDEDQRQSEAKSASPDDTAAASLIGEVISGRYRVTELIATGGMSSVYLGQHVHMLKRMAIKVLDPKAEQLPELVARFQREAIAGAHIQHPNIASATDFGQLKDGSYFLVLEYVPGVTLNRVIAQGPVSVQRAVSIARQLASGLAAVHDVGIVHRDLKPTNVILVEGSNDVVKIIDFGFAQVRLSKVPTIAPPPDEPVAPEKFLTAAGVVLGTVAYMAPEAALGMAAVDHRSDLYALGLIMYELLAGKHPFEAADPVQLFLKQRTLPPPPIAVRTPGVSVPQSLEAVVRKLLEKDPKDRYQGGADVISALDAALMSLAFEMVPELSALYQEGGLFSVPAPPETVASAPPVKPPETPASGAAPSAGPSDEVAPATAAPLERWPEIAGRIPGVSAIARALPTDGRFPRWAYVVLPMMALLFVVIMVGLSKRLKRAPVEVAPADVTPPFVPAPPTPMPETREKQAEPVDLDAAGWRMNLRTAARQKEWAKGAEAIVTLLRLDPAALRDHDVEMATRNVAVALEDAGGEPSDKFFGALTNDTGTDGLDVLYDIARFRTWTKAGKRATETLRRPELMMRASRPLKALFEFREASCTARRAQFERLAERGDDRALHELTSLRDADCRRRDPCCFKENRALAAAIRALKARLAGAPLP